MMADHLVFEGEIHGYSRAEALEDGVLVDCSELARQAGFRHPIALTRAVWEQCVELTPEAARAGQDETGRLWDVLWMLSCAIRRERGGWEVGFELRCVGTGGVSVPTKLRAVVGPGDDAAPVITVMLPEES
jgi:hypothetical protein